MDTSESHDQRVGPPAISPRLAPGPLDEPRRGTLIRLAPKVEVTAACSALDHLKEIVADVESGELRIDNFVLCITASSGGSDWMTYRCPAKMSTLERLGLVTVIAHDIADPPADTVPCPPQDDA